ncbi:MAG: fumarylacetoacetate hydrolase family protein [Acidobacteriota bacterium]
MRAYRTEQFIVVEQDGKFYPLEGLSWDELLRGGDVHERARAALRIRAIDFDPAAVLAPIVSQEVWAAGVTYYRSRDARMRESKNAGGGDFYARVYDAPRPELFFKATGRRVVGPGAAVRIRSDARWSVAEPELTLLANPQGEIVGYTIGNDMSSRDIEGENPLYLPQAKVYDGSCALGPCVLLTPEPLPKSTAISIAILRGGREAYAGSTTLHELKREPKELLEYLFRDNSFPDGVFLMTGTGLVPGDEFTLESGDQIRISIQGIGTLANYVA